MLEVCFSDSVKGALHYAQHCKNSIGGASCIAVIGRGKLSWWQRKKAEAKAPARQQKLQAQAVPLGGCKEDLASLSFDFSIGDIAAPFGDENCPRQQLLQQWLTADPWGELEQMEATATKFWQDCLVDLEKLKARAAAGDAIRIWADDLPSSACGLLFAADILQHFNTPVTLVPLPKEYTMGDDAVVQPIGWGDITPELYGVFAKDAVPVSASQLKEMAARWQQLVRENAPLRVVENGHVISAPIDYYDAAILEECPPEGCRVCELIGKVLGRRRLGISDWLVAQRIRALLASGVFTMQKDDPRRFYNAVIART